MAATLTETAALPTLTLTAPDPVPVILPAAASGLVPVSDDNKFKLQAKVPGEAETIEGTVVFNTK